MKKRWLALFLAVVMLFSLSVTAMAAEVRETDFFDDQWHADVDFADMEYVPVDTEAVLAAMDETRALVEDEANIEAVKEGFLAACDLYTNASTMSTLANIHYSLNVLDEALFAAYDEANTARLIVWDGMCALGRDILNSPCAAALDGIVNEEDAEYLREYEDISEEEYALQDEIDALINEYYLAAAVEYSAVVDGVEWTDASCDEAYYDNGEINRDQWIVIGRAVAKEKNAALGEIYLRLVDAYKREAAMNDYDNYCDYSYESYGYTFTPEEVNEFHAAVKEKIAPVSEFVSDVYVEKYTHLSDYDVVFGDYTGDIALDLMDPYIAALSSELYESFNYMRDHQLYDSGFSEKKRDGGFTTFIAGYKAPYFFNSPSGNVLDFTTAVHEFGHYNNFYWTDGSWYNGSKSIDIAEVHSQALELLFTQFYPELFGEEVAEFLTVLLLDNMIESAIIQGALQDELQQFVFGTEDVTLQQINEKYCSLCKEYLVVSPDDERTEMYSWVDTHHFFDHPLYYISYAVSAAGSLEFWLAAQDDYFAAVDDYLRFTAQKMDEYDFQESFEAVGLQSPFSAEFIEALAEKMITVLNSYKTPTAAEYFADVTGEESWYDAVSYLYDNGVLNGVEAGVLEPDGALTRAQASTVLCRIFGLTEAQGADYFPDVTEGHWYTGMVNCAFEYSLINGFEDGTFRPNDTMSRQDFAVLIYNIFTTYLGSGFEGAWAFDLGAADADQIGDYAFEAVSWGVMNGYITLDENANLRPTDDLTRAEMADMIYNAFFAG